MSDTWLDVVCVRCGAPMKVKHGDPDQDYWCPACAMEDDDEAEGEVTYDTVTVRIKRKYLKGSKYDDGDTLPSL